MMKQTCTCIKPSSHYSPQRQLVCCSRTISNKACLIHGVSIMLIYAPLSHLCLKWRILKHNLRGSTPISHMCIPQLNMRNNCWMKLLSGSKYTIETIVYLVFWFGGIISNSWDFPSNLPTNIPNIYMAASKVIQL